MLHQQRFTFEKLSQRLALIAPLATRRAVALRPFRFRQIPDHAAPPVAPEFDDSDWPTIPPGSYWGSWNTHFALRTSFSIPTGWTGDPLTVYLPLGEAGEFSHPEALLYLDGESYATCDRHHQEVMLPALLPDTAHTLTLIVWTGRELDPHARLLMRTCALRQIDPPTREFVALARVTLGVIAAIENSNPIHGRLLNALDAAFQLLDTREPLGDRFYAGVPAALKQLRADIATAGPPLDVTLTAAGHAHIDVAWLWPLAQTRRKAARTFHNVLRLMEEFPDYHFTQSQPQLYDFVRQDHPQLFEAIRQRVGEGRWEATGGMWVEADCNLSGAESLARQFLLGRTFFREQFGPEAESPILWLPDVFGYAWNLPQLIKQAGLEYFFTIKIGWSQYNRMPYDTFWWQGLDGTRVLTHFSPAKLPEQRSGDYNAPATPAVVLEGWRHFQQKELSSNVLMAYGYGDGGGGPTREMQENLRELRAFPAMPQVRRGKALDFFRDLEAEANGRFPVWKGELYLELHRGTYTTQARNKRANRQSEFLLHDAEFLATYAALLSEQFHAGGDDIRDVSDEISAPSEQIYRYPHAALRRAWELVCLNQFHDIIPGSSINQVYVESLAQYAEVRALAEQVQQEALVELSRAAGADMLVVNPTSFARRDLALWPSGVPERVPSGVVSQVVENGVLLDVGAVPSYALLALHGRSSGPIGALSVSPTHLENDFLRVEFDAAGDITQIYDKRHGRHVMPPGTRGNQWQAFEDRPLDWDAWDIDIFYDDKQWLAEPATAVTVVEAGPLRAALRIERHILNSSYTQHISLCHNSARLDFATRVDWRERHILLKAAFPVDVLSATATYEIQWGSVERPTHRNTSWDWARFETCAQKWVDLSEGGYGVSLLNDCKYGHDIQDRAPQGGVVRLTLLRSPSDPDPDADQGVHYFTYSLLPHGGRWGVETIAQSYALNDPLRVYAAPPAEAARAPMGLPSLVGVDAAHVVIETVKQAEDGGGVIVRLYEALRQRGPVTLRLGFGVTAVYRTNLLEEDETELPHDDTHVTFEIRPFEIVTLRLVPARAGGSP